MATRWPFDIGREMAGGMLAASLRDFGRYGLLMLNKGKSGNVKSSRKIGFETQPDLTATRSTTAPYTMAILLVTATSGGYFLMADLRHKACSANSLHCA